ncbi:restriction endonuclease subunit S [Mycobacterium sp. E735]|uniref:restriction endonuclease subunit S n=1 Tax=Mycobacterium sp. E735 TaxID=1834148 RepID=UPI0008013AEB|nr:restriction endonuclease subunit S [Mycobacterium sp. E735]OBG63327.1 hypothetical protein A5704_02050 [Mycobacterium sp. E735]
MTLLGELLVDAQPGFACGREETDGVFQFRMNNITKASSLDLSVRRRVPLDAHKKISTFFVAQDDVLFNATNSPDNVGKSVLIPELDEKAVFSNHFIRLRVDREALIPAYLWRWLQWKYQAGLFRSMCRQWVNQATVSRESLLQLEISLPPLDEQRRIAVTLDLADGIRVRRRQVLNHLEHLAQSTFFQMFGDPMKTGDDSRPLGAVCDVITGNTPSRSDPANYGDGIEWIKSDNLGGTIATRSEEHLTAIGRNKARIVPAGSVLVTCIAGSPNSIGKASLVDREVAFNQQINAAVPGPTVNGRFLLEQLKVAPRLVRQQSTGGMKGLVSKSNFASIRIHVPPLSSQGRFVEIAKEIDTLRERQTEALAHGDDLVRSLQGRAFSGQL